MDTLQLSNYRRFKDTGIVHLKPLTFLVGANSSGKSSFLKFFPLLKQSLGVNRNGTFLWYSNDVDFKDFENTVHNGKGSINISFTFPLRNPSSQLFDFLDNNNDFDDFSEKYIKKEVEISVKLEISAKSKSKDDYFSLIVIQFLDQKIEIHISEDEKTKLFINDQEFEIKLHAAVSNNSVFLIPRFFEENNDGIYSNKIGNVVKYFKKTFDKDNEKWSFFDFSDSFYLMEQKATLKYMKLMNIQNEDMLIANDMYILLHLNNIIDNINSYLYDVSSNITYVRPLRVSTERYYRYQNYAVNEIDSDGKNLAMYLANLSDQQMIRFTDWTSKLFGFQIRVLKHEGHIELQIFEGNEIPRNLVDTGFGYTQLLPIVTMIWNAMKFPLRRSIFRNRSNAPKIIVIEQPELHLHPRFQAKFGAMLSKVITNGEGNNIKFIIETHSEAILNSIGIQIERQNLNKDSVNVVLFNADAEGYENYIEEVQFNNRGFIDHWPTGFLSEDVY